MAQFTDELLQLEPGTVHYYSPDTNNEVLADTWDIEIPLQTFSADDLMEPETYRPGSGGPELIRTSIRLDFVEMPASKLSDLSQQTFTFPVNPKDGYIDGSIYLQSSHCPIDITVIEFGEAVDGQIPATLHAYFDFDSAGVEEICNRSAVLKTNLHFPLREADSQASAGAGPEISPET